MTRIRLSMSMACWVLMLACASSSGLEQTKAAPPADNNCTRYVDNQASTDGDGSLNKPWNNIAGHVDNLKAGDVLCVRGAPSAPGRVYTEAEISLDTSGGTLSGTAESPIIVRAFPGEHVVLHSTGTKILYFRGVAHWQFDGFAFDKQSANDNAINFRQASFNVVRNCEIYNGKGEGIHFSSGEYNIIEDCTIHDFNGGPSVDAHCILLAGGTGNIIRNNEIYNCTGDGVQLYDYQDIAGTIIENNQIYNTLGPCAENAIDVKMGGQQTTVIRGNTMHGYRRNDGSCGGTGGSTGEAVLIHVEATNILLEGNEIYDSGSGIRVLRVSNLQIINNLVHDIINDPSAWADFGIQIYEGVNVDILNNTVASIPRDALLIGDGLIQDLDIRNNLFYNTGRIGQWGTGIEMTADYNGWFNAAERIEGPHDVVGSNPLFAAPGDYHLQAASPAVDAGDSAHAPSNDFDGNPRPRGSGVDLGAFEVQGPPVVTDLRVSTAVSNTDSVTVTLVWTAPGRVGQPSSAHHYELRYDYQVVSAGRWDQAAVAVPNIPAEQPGEAQSITVNVPWSSSGHVYFALRVFDIDSLSSGVSNPAFWPFVSTFLALIMQNRASLNSYR